MNTEMQILMATTILTMLHPFPYVIAYAKYWGIPEIFGNRDSTPELPLWAMRAQRAHQNMNENFLHFAVLVLAANYLQVSTGLTALGATLFFWARLGFLVTYLAGIRWIRSAIYAVGLTGEVIIIQQILTARM